ncbi:right-handed parallel beta-helix repeat-containing protein [Haloferula sp. BvORR071]|uniref:right-handed parallel beta-helix repeat-containing protein n=1 Tax=Haloferula sp. BvORR071 TaxID=1396141 RepID=UPI002240FC47|nr:right-handed parallel beta-helix repeat-containing protein [Haloferula sp. BvORR071]
MSELPRMVRMRLFLPLLFIAPLAAETVVVKNPSELSAAIGKLKDGDTLKIGPGEYPGGNSVGGVANLTVEALDPKSPPLFKGGSNAWQFSRCQGLKLRYLHCRGQTGNGFNIDDGGKREEPVKGVVIEDLRVEDIGPQGNFDGIKCSGLQDLRIERCEISGWGGQAIDFVGCSESVITGCRISGKEGFSQHTGPQFKGGCSKVIIEMCTFKDAGERPIQVGGSTGLDYFRPPGAKYEAKDIIVRGNTIEGGMCACAFTGVDGAEFSNNTILRPEKWIFRVLQETRVEGFAPCRNVKVMNNKITFRREQVGTELNISEGTAPETFVFEGNRWLAEDRPQASKPKLPVEEKGGVYGEAVK